MHPRSFIALLLAAAAQLVWIPASGFGSDVSEVERLITAHEEALGGRQRLAGIETMQLAGSYTFNGETFAFTLSRQRPDRFHLRIEQPEMDAVEASDGEICWRVSRGTEGKASILDSEATMRCLEEWADFDGPLIDFAEKGNRVELVGTETIDGLETHHLLLHLRSGNQQHWFLDSETYLPVRKITPQVHPRRGPYDRVWYFESYQEVEGLQVPEYFEREDRQFVRAFEVTDVRFNIDLPPNLFSPPQP